MASQSKYVQAEAGTQNWTNGVNATGAPDTTCATSATNAQVNDFDFTGDLFTIPGGSTIDGIEVVVVSAASDSDDDYDIALMDPNSVYTTAKLGANSDGTACANVAADAALGSPTDDWTPATAWTVTWLNSTSFRVRLSQQKSGKGGTTYVDSIYVTIHYTTGATTYYEYLNNVDATLVDRLTKTLTSVDAVLQALALTRDLTNVDAVIVNRLTLELNNIDAVLLARALKDLTNVDAVLVGRLTKDLTSVDAILVDRRKLVSSIFSDDYETGDKSKWTNESTTSGETVTVVSTDPFRGTYHLRAYADGSGDPEHAYVYKTITSSAEVYARFRVKVVSEGGGVDNDRIHFISFDTLAFTGLLRAGWIWQTGVRKWHVYGRDGATWPHDKGSAITAGWHEMEVYWLKHATQGIVRLWVDGSLEAEVTGINTADYGNCVNVITGLTASWNSGEVEVYVDNFEAGVVEQPSVTVDAVVVDRLTKTLADVDAYLISRVLKTFTADAVLTALTTEYKYLNNVDAVLVNRLIKTLSNVDAVLVNRLTKTLPSVDAYLISRVLKTFTADAVLSGLAVVDKYLNSVDAVLVDRLTKALANVDAHLVDRYTKDLANVDAVLVDRITKTLPSVDAVLKLITEKTLPAVDAVLVDRLLRTLTNVDAVLVNRYLKTLPSVDAYLISRVLKTLTVDAVLVSLGAVDKYLNNVDAVLVDRLAKTLPSVDAVLSLRIWKTLPSVDAVLKLVTSVTVPVDAVLMKRTFFTFTADAVLEWKEYHDGMVITPSITERRVTTGITQRRITSEVKERR